MYGVAIFWRRGCGFAKLMRHVRLLGCGSLILGARILRGTASRGEGGRHGGRAKRGRGWGGGALREGRGWRGHARPPAACDERVR